MENIKDNKVVQKAQVSPTKFDGGVTKAGAIAEFREDQLMRKGVGKIDSQRIKPLENK